jgi:hypothetical protein
MLQRKLLYNFLRKIGCNCKRRSHTCMSSFFPSFEDKTVIVNFQHEECYGEILGVWLICFPTCFWEIVSSKSRTLFFVKHSCFIGFMNKIRSIISKKKKINCCTHTYIFLVILILCYIIFHFYFRLCLFFFFFVYNKNIEHKEKKKKKKKKNPSPLKNKFQALPLL